MIDIFTLLIEILFMIFVVITFSIICVRLIEVFHPRDNSSNTITPLPVFRRKN